MTKSFIFAICFLNVITRKETQFVPYASRLLMNMPVAHNPLVPYLLEKPCCNSGGQVLRDGRRLVEDQEEGNGNAMLLKDILEMTKNNLERASAFKDEIAMRRNYDYLTTTARPTTSPSPSLTSPQPVSDKQKKDLGNRTSLQKAYECSELECTKEEEISTIICACNFKTGNTVSFKNECDLKKHNCRFDTGFKTILNEVCPWEFDSRAGTQDIFIDYKNPRYYN